MYSPSPAHLYGDWLQARVYLLSAGFSLAFGSMFTKTYRVHRIFTMSYGCYGSSKKKVRSCATYYLS